jgi:hypothetical protein
VIGAYQLKPTRWDATKPGAPVSTSTGQPNPNHQAQRTLKNTVNEGLTPKRPRPVTENSEYAAFARRILRAYSRRIATGDIESLTHLITLADDINDTTQQAVNGLRTAGYSWTDIATRLGITRQAAQQRWGRPQTSEASGNSE